MRTLLDSLHVSYVLHCFLKFKIFQIQNQFVAKILNMVGLNIKTKFPHAGKYDLITGNQFRNSHKFNVSTTCVSKWYIL